MTGTDKQVEWASEIKASRIAEAEALLAEVDAKRAALPADKLAASQPAYDALRRGLERIKSEQSAAAIIAWPKSIETRTLLRDLGK